MSENPPRTTTDGGAPVASDEFSLTVGPDGPILLQDQYLIEQMANFNRERIPERQPHAKGAGAFGVFETTEDVSAYTRAALFQPGVRTEMLARFSTVAGESGSPDTWRDPRGFALKFYTAEGNYDMVGNNTPVFFVRDPMKFQHFIRSQKRRADNGLRDHDMQWDFWTLSPESAHQVTWLMGDRGIPKTWRHMNGYSSHTYMWVNAGGEKFWVKYHFKTDQGIDFLTQEDADRIAGENADYHRQDLFEAIRDGDFPTLDAVHADHAVRGGQDLPLQPVRPDQGLAARRLPADQGRHDDAQPQPDRLPHRDGAGRVRAQQPRAGDRAEPGQDAARARVLLRRRAPGPARGQLQADPGQHAARRRCTATARTASGGRSTSPIPSTRPTPTAARRPTRRRPTTRACGRPTATWSARPTRSRAEDDDFGQAGTMVREVLDDDARERLVGNVAGHLCDGVSDKVLARAFEYWKNIDAELGERIEQAVGANVGV